MQQTEQRESANPLGNSTIGETQPVIVPPTSTPPQLILDARDKFAPQLVRLLADLKMAHGDTDPADIMDLHDLSNQMDIWRQTNVIECEPS